VVRATLDPAGPVTVGQSVALNVDIFVPTFFMQPPDVPGVDVANASAELQPGGFNLTDRINDETWSGIRRTFRIVAEAPGTIRIPPIAIVARYAVDGKLTDPFTVSTPALAFEATVPPGAEALDYFFAARDLRLTERYDRRPEKLKIGDAFTRTLTMGARGVSALSLPEVALDAPPGVAVHVDPPDVTAGTRDKPEASRVEKATYTVTREGHYTLPVIEVRYWNTAGNRIASVTLPEVTFEVEAAAAFGEEIALPPEPDTLPKASAAPAWVTFLRTNWRWLGAGLVLAVFGLIAVRRLAPHARADWQQLRQRITESEPLYFHHMRAAARRGNLRETHARALEWLTHFPPTQAMPTLAQLALLSGDAELAYQAGQVKRALYSPQGPPADDRKLAAGLAASVTRARRRLRSRHDAHADAHALVPLNPK
jgi:hypothetical protein